MVNSLYDYTARLGELFPLLQDEKSRAIFWDRLKCDIYLSLEHITDLYADAFDLDHQQRQREKELGDRARQLSDAGKKLLLYGAGGCGQATADAMQVETVLYAAVPASNG